MTGVGELSLTACHALIKRILCIGRPVRILYLSDFDPAGASMPVAAVARKIEFLHARGGHDLDLQVRPVVLTHEQCIEYRLPRTPIKTTEPRAARFEERFGAGATELDALQALHPGELRRILEGELDRYYDHTLSNRIEEHADTAREQLNEITRRVHRDHHAQIEGLRAEYAKIHSGLEAWRKRAGVVWQAITEDLSAEAPEYGYGWPEPEAGDEDLDPLFDSTRDYLTQIARYKRHQGKAGGGEPGGNEADA